MTAEPTGKLTRKEKRFAAAIAAGETMAEAYARTYSSRAGRHAAESNARQVLKRPRVAAEVQRLRRHPPAENFAALREFAIEKLVEMAESDANPMARHKALSTLLEHSEEGLRRPAPPPAVVTPDNSVDRRKIIEELHKLYEKALGPKQLAQNESEPEALVNDQWDEDDITAKPDDGQSADRELGAVHNGDGHPGDGCADIEEQGVVGQLAPQDGTMLRPANADQYEWVALPGYFGKARRVRLRVG
jgi:hypothetical protein